MSDIGDAFKDHRKHLAEKKRIRREHAMYRLDEEGIQYDTFNKGLHIRIQPDIDYWPSTGRINVDGRGRDNGVETLIGILRKIEKGT